MTMLRFDASRHNSRSFYRPCSVFVLPGRRSNRRKDFRGASPISSWHGEQHLEARPFDQLKGCEYGDSFGGLQRYFPWQTF